MSSQEDEKKDWPVCVFYPDEVKCPVRFSMVSSSSMKKIMEPLTPKTPKFDDRTTGMEIGKSMMEGVMKASGMEWSVLAAFCHICPFKYKKDQEALRKALGDALQPTLDQTMKAVRELEQTATPLDVCPKCGMKGFFNYCPKCGTKVAEKDVI